MEGWEFATLQGMWEGLRWVLRLFPFIVAAAVIIAIWRQYLKTKNVRAAKHLLEIRSTDTTEINRVISELDDFNAMSKKVGHHDETINVLIQELRQLRDSPSSEEEKVAEFAKPVEPKDKMPTFSYKALDKNGTEVSGTLEADDEKAVLSRLKNMGCYATEIKEIKPLFDAILKEVGPQKIQVIKVVLALTGLGLRGAKSLVDQAPTYLKTRIPKEEAEEIKKKLEEVGAKVELK